MLVLVEETRKPGLEYVLSAPSVGILTVLTERGVGLPAGGLVGRLRVLNKTFELRLPHKVSGTVLEALVPAGYARIQYGQPLLRLGVGQSPAALTKEGREGHGIHAGNGYHLVRSPSDGIFYRRPEPGAPPYVEADHVVTLGQTLGLVEVMKCFNHIQYSGPDLAESATVVAIGVDDAAEVKAGDVLFTLSPF
ncbi:hypothetical protein JW905_05940 [bacterium]|nr:hypothetical protein [candidate division CSSED10-310 bacterium]